MIHSILYFEENCIKIFEKLENDFLRNPKNFAEYVYGIVDELYKLGKEMLKESIETMNNATNACVDCLTKCSGTALSEGRNGQ